MRNNLIHFVSVLLLMQHPVLHIFVLTLSLPSSHHFFLPHLPPLIPQSELVL